MNRLPQLILSTAAILGVQSLVTLALKPLALTDMFVYASTVIVAAATLYTLACVINYAQTR